MAYDVIGLIHPTSLWHDRKCLMGAKIEIIKIEPYYAYPGWYKGAVKLLEPKDDQFDIIHNTLQICGFRPRRVLK